MNGESDEKDVGGDVDTSVHETDVGECYDEIAFRCWEAA